MGKERKGLAAETRTKLPVVIVRVTRENEPGASAGIVPEVGRWFQCMCGCESHEKSLKKSLSCITGPK